MSLELFSAIERHDLAAIAALLATGADPNAPHPEQPLWTPLKEAIDAAADGGPADTGVLLLRHGAAVDGRRMPGDATPLIVAAQHSVPEVVRILLAAGADPAARDDEGDTALSLCIRRGDHEMAKLLRLCGAEAEQ